MPNLTNNYAIFSHRDSKVIEKAYNAFSSDSFLNTFIPSPDNDNVDNDDWYEENWGCFRDLEADTESLKKTKGGFEVYFLSVAGEPIRAYEKLAKKGFKIEAYYFDMQSDRTGSWINGEFNEYDLSETTDLIKEVFICSFPR
jgi:hypothetical protein